MKIYLDNGATTPLSKEAFEAMKPYFCEIYGNASSLHNAGRLAAQAIQKARETVAECVNADPGEIIFTGSGTESDNIALQGVINAAAPDKRHVIISSIEHHGVLHIADNFEKRGFEVSRIGVDKTGKVNAQDVINAVKGNTAIISVMHANNEVGTVQPIAEIAVLLKEVNAGRAQRVYFHSDCVQTAGKLPLDVKALGVDLISMASHKFYGPKGIGALYIKKGVNVKPLLFGGAQERGLRPGTENVAGIVGFAKALEIAVKDLKKNAEHVRALRAKLRDAILKTIPETVINGDFDNAAGGILNAGFKYIEGEALLLKLNNAGVAVSTGSACAASDLEASHVLSAMRVCDLTAQGALRFSIGSQNTEQEIDYVISVLPKIVEDLRKMSPLWKGA